MLSKSIIVLAVFLFQLGSALKCYSCIESRGKQNETHGGKCYKPTSDFTSTENDCQYCEYEVYDMPDKQGKYYGNNLF
jgi:hypothetical protein